MSSPATPQKITTYLIEEESTNETQIIAGNPKNNSISCLTAKGNLACTVQTNDATNGFFKLRKKWFADYRNFLNRLNKNDLLQNDHE